MHKKSKEKSKIVPKLSTEITSDSSDVPEGEHGAIETKSESHSSKTPESQDPELFESQIDSSDFSGPDLKESRTESKQYKKEVSRRVSFEGSKGKGRVSVEESDSDDIHFVMLPSSNKSRKLSAQKRRKDRDFQSEQRERVLIRKTEEVMDIPCVKFVREKRKREYRSGDRRTDLSDHKSKSGGKKSDFRRELKMRVVNEKKAIDSSRGDHPKRRGERKTRSLVKNQSYEGSLKTSSTDWMNEKSEEKVNQDLISEKYSFKNRFVTYFLDKYKKFSKENEFTQAKAVESKRSKILMDDFGIPQVSLEEDLLIKSYLQEFYFYILFLIFVTTIALSMIPTNTYYLTEMTTNLFFDTPNVNVTGDDPSQPEPHYPMKTLRESNTFGDFWAFAETTMINMFYWNFYYSHLDPIIHTLADDRKMFYENQLLGVPRIRQVRVRNDSCEIHPVVRRFFISCYYFYSVFSEETRPIRTDMMGSKTATAWRYTEAKVLKTTSYWGEISTYGGGGYYLDLSPSKAESAQMVNELKEKLWVSRATRAIFIDFNIYNANVNLFCICKIILEFPPVGGMIPKADFQSLKLIRYLTSLDFFILGLEIVFLLFIAYYTYKEILNIRRQGLYFILHVWNAVDTLILLLAYLYIVLSVVVYIYTTEFVSTLSSRSKEYTEFGFVRALQINYNNVIAVLTFTCWIKPLKFLNFNITMLEFNRTLSRSLRDIFGFFPMFLTIFLAFALLAYLLFGNQVKSYHTVWASFLALLQAFLGEFRYEEIQESNRVLGPIFYMALIFFIFFILLNVFIAIINDAYTCVKSEVIPKTPRVGTYVKRGFRNFLGFCFCGLDRKLANKTKMKRNIIFEEIRRVLKRAGFTDLEIEIFFSKYNINVNNLLDGKTRRKIIEDLELKRIDFSETTAQYQMSTLRRRIDGLNDRIQDIEVSLQPVIDKVDIIFNRHAV